MQKKKKILYVITKSNWGGAQRYVYDLATGLDKKKFEVSVLLGGSGVLEKRLGEKKIRTIIFPNLERDVNIIKDVKVFFNMTRLLSKEKPDIIHLNSSKAGMLGAIAAKIAGVRNIIFTAHGFAFNEERSLLSKTIIILSYSIGFLACDQIIAVSDNVKKIASRFPFASSKTTRIYNGIDSPAVFIGQEEARRHFVGTSKGPIIGTITELHRNKGLETAIIAMKKVLSLEPSAHLVIVGPGDERKNLEELVVRLGISTRVIFTGYLEKAANYLKAFDVFIFPSVTEALGYALLEAGLAGLPVIGSKVGGIPEILENDKTGFLVDPRDHEKLSDKIVYLIKNKEHGSYLGKNLNEAVLNYFDLKRMLSETEDLYH